MFNRIDAGFRSPANTLRAVRMRGHAAAEPVCVRHDCLHFFERVLRSVGVIAFREHAAGGANLDHVCAVLDDFANFVLHAFDAISDSVSLKMKCGR